QSVHTASIVDDLAKNTSKALGIQEDIDRKLEDRLNALYDAVRFLGEEVQGLKLRTKIRCHANYRWICVTPKIYNDTETPWDRVKSHLDGIWHNENISLDLLQLHQEILDIENAPRASMDLAENAEEGRGHASGISAFCVHYSLYHKEICQRAVGHQGCPTQ
ncbi:Env gp36 protein, partial [Onchocerca flexuosa]